MKANLVLAIKSISSSLLTAIFIIIIVFAALWKLPGILPVSNNQPTSQTASTLPQVVAGTPTPLDYSDALHTYELVATTAIQSAERALNLMVVMLTAIIGLAALAAGAASYLYKTAKEAEDRAKSAEVSAQSAKTAAENANQQLNSLSKNYIELNNRFTDILQNYIEIRNKTLSLDAAIQASDKGEISHERYLEAQHWNSWHKWVDLKQETGLHELKAFQSQEAGLVPAIRVVIEMELARVFRDKPESELSNEEKIYKQNLLSLREIKTKSII